MKSNDKVQLNLCVDLATDNQFRTLAQKAGYGKRPSPFLSRLLELFGGSMRAMHRRVRDLLEKDPDFLMQREQLFYAQELYLVLRDAIGEAQDRMTKANEQKPKQ
jgi:hypothetical protein